MIMRPGQPLLLPANPAFIWASLLGALLLNLVLDIGWLGRAPWSPDWLALLLVFWSVHQPQRVGMLAAFVLGVVMDVHQGALLGQHALAYSVLSFLSIAVHRRLLWFPLSQQALQVLPLLLCAHAIQWLLRLVGPGSFPGWGALAAPLLEALLWPLASVLLLAPQRRAPDPDANRPL